MLSLEDGKKAVSYARKVIDHRVKNGAVPSDEIGAAFSNKHGAFVTIHSFPAHSLRGCIGVPLPVMPLNKAIADGASSATHDPRFPPLSEEELDNIIVEVTVLSKPTLIEVDDPKDYLSEVKIGRDGLIVEQGMYKGLLLPQVPVEQKWDKETYLSQTCMKAGLMPDCWFDEKTKISKFSGQIFSEKTPRGEIEEKKIDGSKC